MPQLPDEDPPQGALSAAVSTLLVQCFREHVGRGPTKARTWLHANLITSLLEDTLTHGERTLIENGDADLVIAIRRAHISAMRPALVSGIEALTSRTVTAVMSDTILQPEQTVMAITLAPKQTT